MMCGRPGCSEAEDRINGYCSVYCEDVAEATERAEKAEARVTELEAAVEVARRAQEFFAAAIEHDDDCSVPIDGPCTCWAGGMLATNAALKAALKAALSSTDQGEPG